MAVRAVPWGQTRGRVGSRPVSLRDLCRFETCLGVRPRDRSRRAQAVRARSVLVAERLEGGPAGIAVLLLVRVRLVVQVLPALAAEAGAVLPAEDLLRERESDRVPRPGRDV